MAVQGPKAEDVVAAVFGDWVRALKYFWFAGFEIYLRDGFRGVELWNIIKEAGEPWGIGPGNPSPIERIESGLLSYGGDTDDQTNPFEVRLEKYVDLDLDDDVVGIKALRQINLDGIKRQQLGAWSPRAQSMIGFALVGADAAVGDKVEVVRGGYRDPAMLCPLPFF